VVTRYGGEEFVVVMPQTDLAGACIFSERCRKTVADNLPLTVSCGVATALDGDNAQTILSRADSALYSAKAAGRNLVYEHDGRQIKRVEEEVPATV
jgi:diguanylate cyclase